jgi:chemotaxis protein MotB
MRTRKSLLPGDDHEENFWPAFTDLTSTIALILFVLVLLAYLQNLLSGKNLQYIKSQLDDTLARLSSSQAEISRSEKKLALLENDMKRTRAEIEAGSTQLKLSEEKVIEQEAVIAESNRELGNLRARLQDIAVLRIDVLRRVKSAIEAELSPKSDSDTPLVLIADNGNIVINESLVFEYNSHRIKKGGKALLNTLAKAFVKLLTDKDVKENIDVILVQGHTDERGSIPYNRDLSAKRANTVLNYMFEAEAALGKSFGSYFASSAYSEFRPINPDRTENAFEQNRRIEISVVVKDSNVQSVIDEYLRSHNPVFRER